MTQYIPFVGNTAACGGVGTGFVWRVKVSVPSGVSSQTFTVAVNGTTVATLTGSASYGPFDLVGPDTLTVTANAAQSGQNVQLDGSVSPYSPIPDRESGLTAPLELPAAPGEPLTTQGGITLDDGSTNASGFGNINGNNLFVNSALTNNLMNRANDGPANLVYGIRLTSNSSLNSGSGAPTIAGTAGDFFFRTDTPTVTNQRIYVCTVTGGAGAATWVGIV